VKSYAYILKCYQCQSFEGYWVCWASN